ncbi:baseplate hub protein [Acinetobacter guillouiae]|uniref:baseplate hub protein n=1 Tax=Acinetobacter guillouiae TaxID=106649 RepID=UPI003C6FAA1E
MTMQWMRNFRLTIQVDQNTPDALDFSDFKITFSVSQPTNEQPKAAEIYIYNLSHETMNKLAGVDDDKKNTQIILACSYGDDEPEVIFKGRVFQYRRGRYSPVDTYLCVLAIAGDQIRNEAVINQSVPAGTPIFGLGELIVEEAKKFGVGAGDLVQLSDQKYPRGRTIFGSFHGFIERVGRENNITYDYSEGVLNSTEVDKYSIQPMYVLTADTGMVGMPQLTSEGLVVKCLLNPKLKRMDRIQIDLTNLQSENYDIAYSGQEVDQPYKTPKLAANAKGIFVIQAIEHNGDTRGDEWYTSMVCTALGAVVPKSGITINAVDESWRPQVKSE